MFYQIYLVSLLVATCIIATEVRAGYDNHEPVPTRGLLYPRESESREVRTLDGIWQFVKSDINDPLQGLRERWFDNDLAEFKLSIPMPVPASYNDITTSEQLRDHIGTVWYERKFFVPRSWALDQRVWLRFSSVHYAAIVWLNGQQVIKHEIGHLPFEAEVTYALKFGAENRVTVVCDNTLLNTTVPQGFVTEEASDKGERVVQTYTFDFFNYAGIHRSVHLYTTPKIFIQDINVLSTFDDDSAQVHYSIIPKGEEELYDPPVLPLVVRMQLRDRKGFIVANETSVKTLTGILEVLQAQQWWPYLMHPEPGYLYTLEAYLHSDDGTLLDVYRLKIGIRTLEWNNSTLLINHKPVYMRGFGRHEDSDLRGKGLDLALLTRDFSLLQWIGANAYRTSHYPYSEESMEFADEHGIMIIDECPSVNTDIFEPMLLFNHKAAIEQLIHRDRNHPSVIMWSVANEPRTTSKQAEIYFRILTKYTRNLDRTRPITASINVDHEHDKLAQYLDIISFNRYNAWYQNAGYLDMITLNVVNEATAWHQAHNKPVLMSEYGADTLEGLHSLPTYIWSEDYQSALFVEHFKAFDKLREKRWFIGEFVWNFADFKTAQTFTRVGGNKKGVFTRNRQPKAAAYLLRQRYFSLSQVVDQNAFLPADLFKYVCVAETNSYQRDSSVL